jgi:hypothetical protein
MGLFSNKGATDPKRSGGFSLTGVAAGKGRIKAVRNETKGSGTSRRSPRPGK